MSDFCVFLANVFKNSNTAKWLKRSKVPKILDCAKRAIIFNIKIKNAEGIHRNFISLQTFQVYPGYDETVHQINIRTQSRLISLKIAVFAIKIFLLK
jgi:hypothetical protein